MPYSSQYYGRWQNLARDRVGRFVLWIVKWWLYLCITYMILNGIHGYITGKYPLNKYPVSKQSYNLHDIKGR